MIQKACTLCREMRPLSDFSPSKITKDRKGSRCKPCCKDVTRDYRRRNPHKRREHYLANKERVLENQAAYRIGYIASGRQAEVRRAHYQRNKERVAKTTKDYRQSHLEIYAKATAKRLAAKRSAHVNWANEDAISAMYAEAARLSAETGVPHEVDHIVPVQGKTVCGLHWEGNMQILTREANRSKGRHWWPDMP